MRKESRKKRIFKSIGLIAGGLAAGFLLVFGALYYQGTFRGLFIKERIVLPEGPQSIVFRANGQRFVFDTILYHDYDLVSGDERLKTVSLDEWQKIASLLQGSTKVTRDRFLMHKFEESNPTVVTLYVRPEGSKRGAARRAYQSIQFLANSDYYRIELPQQEGPYVWDYYRYPLAHQKMQEIVGVKR